jgi:hypothetical protein
MSTAAEPVSRPKTSRMAIAGLLLGIAGLCTCGIGAVPGLIVGIVSLVQVRRHRDSLKGEGLAVAAIVVSAACLYLGVTLGLPILGLFIIFRNEIRDWAVDLWEEAEDQAVDEDNADSADAPAEPAEMPPPEALVPQLQPVHVRAGLRNPWNPERSMS